MARTSTRTHCPYCSLQCGVVVTAGDRPAELVPDVPSEANLGGLCSKGWTAAELLDHPDRLLTPLVRERRGDRTSALRPASWDEALDRVVDAVLAAQQAHGRDAVGLFGGGGMTNEKAYALGKFARVVLRTRHVDYNGRYCMSSAAAALNAGLGVDRGMPFPLADVAAADAVLVVGGNPASTMPPAMAHFDAGRARGAVHVVVDPRRTPTAAGATQHLQVVPGTDGALALGMLHHAVRDGLVDEAYVAERTTGFDAARRNASQWWPDRTERTTGVPEAQVRAAVHALAEADRAIVLTARGAEQHAHGTATVSSWIDLALALGLPGREGSGYATITGQGNGQGGREHGLKADQLPGYRMITDPEARRHVAAVWDVDPDDLPGPGVSASEMLAGIGTEGGVRALVVMASNVAVSAPDARAVRAQLGRLDALVVSDFFLSETAELADVVLPSAQWAEEGGTMTNLEGRVQLRRRALPPPEGVLDDLGAIHALADRLGHPKGFPTDPEEVFEELRRASAGGRADYSGISYRRLDEGEGLFWPCPADDHPGTPRLFTDRFPTPDGRARFAGARFAPRHERTSRAFPYVLTTGRTMAQYQSGTQTRRVRQLAVQDPEAHVELHPDLAARHGIAHGDLVHLSTARATARFRARVTDSIGPGTLFVPFHWGGDSSANALTAAVLDPTSRMPAFKASAARIEPVPAEQPAPPARGAPAPPPPTSDSPAPAPALRKDTP